MSAVGYVCHSIKPLSARHRRVLDAIVAGGFTLTRVREGAEALLLTGPGNVYIRASTLSTLSESDLRVASSLRP